MYVFFPKQWLRTDVLETQLAIQFVTANFAAKYFYEEFGCTDTCSPGQAGLEDIRVQINYK